MDASTGIITGTPRSTTSGVQTVHKITAKENGAEIMSTSIYIEIADFNLPYNVRFTKNDGNLPTKEVNIVRGESVIIHTKYDGSSTGFQLISLLRDGFELDTKTGIYSGICQEKFSQE